MALDSGHCNEDGHLLYNIVEGSVSTISMSRLEERPPHRVSPRAQPMRMASVRSDEEQERPYEGSSR